MSALRFSSSSSPSKSAIAMRSWLKRHLREFSRCHDPEHDDSLCKVLLLVVLHERTAGVEGSRPNPLGSSRFWQRGDKARNQHKNDPSVEPLVPPPNNTPGHEKQPRYSGEAWSSWALEQRPAHLDESAGCRLPPGPSETAVASQCEETLTSFSKPSQILSWITRGLGE